MESCATMQVDISNSQDYQMIICAKSLDILEATQAAASLYGYNAEQLKGLNIAKLCPEYLPNKEFKGVHLKRDNTTFYALVHCFELSICHHAMILMTIDPIEQAQVTGENSLFSLVSGFAHELNTPTGNVIMAASAMENFIGQIEQALTEKKLTSSLLKEQIANVSTAKQHVLSATSRISGLVEQLKRIAVSWALESIVHFNVYDYALHIFLQNQQKLHTLQISYHLECPQDLFIAHDSAAMIQIIEQLVENSCQHAFESRAAGNIYLTISQQDNNIVIDYRDDGIGIDKGKNKHIFELFYTTARSRGLIGLGLNMVFNIVTLRLKGQIKSFASRKGAHFNIVFPLLNHRYGSLYDNNITEF